MSAEGVDSKGKQTVQLNVLPATRPPRLVLAPFVFIEFATGSLIDPPVLKVP